jgi:hypothetical protein
VLVTSATFSPSPPGCFDIRLGTVARHGAVGAI